MLDTGSVGEVDEVLDIERPVADGRMLGRDDSGRVVLVSGGLPGERVRVRITDEHGTWRRAEVHEVLRSAPTRVEPACRSRLVGCGGCDWMHLDSREQLAVKTEVARDALVRLARVDHPPLEAGGAVTATGYRTTARVVGAGGVDGAVGFRREGSHEVVPAAECLVAHPALRDLMVHTSVSAGAEVELRVSAATGERTARVIGPSGRGVGREGLASPDLTVPADVAIGSRSRLTEMVGGTEFTVSAGSFFQSGPEAAALLVQTVQRLVPELDTCGALLDAYGGVGLFAAALAAPHAERVLVESSPSAAGDARRNLAGHRAHIVQQRFERWRHRGEAFGVAIADPARRGLRRDGVEALVSSRARVVVLVSCDPAAAGRDLGLLIASGYRLEAARVLDLFPQTHHLEIVSRLVLE